MYPGDLIDFDISSSSSVPAIVLEVWDFKKYCDTHDDLELEYDIDDAWNHWQKAGPLLVVLHPVNHTPVKYWTKQEEKQDENR
jgi:hypothetical protein